MAHLSTLACCDQAVFARGLWTLVNVFDHLTLGQFPTLYRRFDVHLGIADLHGQNGAEVSLEIVDLEAEYDGRASTLFEETLILNCGQPYNRAFAVRGSRIGDSRPRCD